LRNKEKNDPLILIDKIFLEISALETDLYTIFRSSESGEHKGIHLRIQETIDNLYDEIRELRRLLFENKC
jgi:hypothetical protein